MEIVDSQAADRATLPCGVGGIDPRRGNSYSVFETISLSFRIWLLALQKALLICTPVMIFLWIYFLPALVTSEIVLDGIRDILYVKILNILTFLFFYSFVFSYFTTAFGAGFCKNASIFFWLPAMIINFFLRTFTGYGGLVLDTVSVVLSAFQIRREKLPENPTVVQLQQFERKNSMMNPLAKMSLIVSIIFATYQSLFEFFIQSTQNTRILIRFVLLPVLNSLFMGFQIHFMRGIEMSHLSYSTPTLWITNGFIKVFEKMIANIMFIGTDYRSYVLATLAATFIEIINHATYMHRVNIVNKTMNVCQGISKRRRKSIRTISVAPCAETHADRDCDVALDTTAVFMNRIRKSLIVEDITIEMVMIFTATLLLYFIHLLIDNKTMFETIKSFRLCVIQIFIQMGFELVSDVFGLYWMISRHGIDLTLRDVQVKDMWLYVWILFMLQQCLWIYVYFLYS
eukprot:TRINITY_DN5388_c0_g1_i5.p1 TRINITY_DN5388_c0_g1~~TRINITY_DN5388_c0_g1_i5.p1  ORF type:complete len:457 (-),score=54.00 TRINITY_DN5388_c0_g1_i5:1016-2386(-)